MMFPTRQDWVDVAARAESPHNGGGLLKLHDDVQTCGYEDVQVMWEILKRTESELMSRPPKRKSKPFWKFFLGHSTTRPSRLSVDHA